MNFPNKVSKLCPDISGKQKAAQTETQSFLICKASAVHSFHSMVKMAGGNHPELTAVSCCGALLSDGLAATLRCAGPHVELVLGRGAEVRETPAGLGRGCDVDVI